MRRFQEWQDNQTYFQHLTNLTKIMNRKTSSRNMRRTIKAPKDIFHDTEVEAQNTRLVKCLQNPGRVHFRQSSSPHVKKQNTEQVAALAYQNFLFGKRILQTEPVISKQKMDRDYEQHRKTLQAMMIKKIGTSGRVKRLKEFYSDFDNSLSIKGEGRHCLSIVIAGFEMYRQRLNTTEEEQISIQCIVGMKKLKSDIIPVDQFVGQHFKFRFRKLHIKQGNPINVFIRYHKGNSDIQLGFFNIQTAGYLKNDEEPFEKVETQSLLKRIGSVAGAITFSFKLQKLGL